MFAKYDKKIIEKNLEYSFICVKIPVLSIKKHIFNSLFQNI